MRIKKPKNILARNYAAKRRGDLAEVQKLTPKVQKLRSFTSKSSATTPSRRQRKPPA